MSNEIKPACFCKIDDEQYFGTSKLDVIEKVIETLSYEDANALFYFMEDHMSERDESEGIDYSDISGLGPAFEDVIWANAD